VNPATSNTRGAKTCTWPNGGDSRGGMMPTTCHGWPLRVMVSLTTDARPPKRVCHNSWLMMQTAGPLGKSSSAVKLRPTAGRTPSVEKNEPLTRKPFSCSGSPLPVSVKLSKAESPIEVNERACCRSSSYRGHEMAGAFRLSCGLLVQMATSDEGLGIVTGL